MGVLALTMINLAIVCTLRGLPIMAEEGFSLIFYLVLTTVMFLIPISLVCAELSTGWPPHGPGGVYIWVNEAFGRKTAFLAIWLQWVQNIVWFPTILAFIGATIAYAFNPELSDNKYYMIAVIMVTFWGGTLLNFRGMKISGLVSTVCVIAGTILPGIIIIALAAIWLAEGNTCHIDFSFRNIFPDMSNIQNIVFLAGVMLTFAGIEVSAAHSQDVKNPKRNFPRAIFLASIIAFTLLALGSLSVAVVIPAKDLNIVTGIMETFTAFLDIYGFKWLMPVMAILIAAGAIGELSAWIIGPAKGLMVTAKDGNLPPFFQKINRHGAPANILLMQGIIATIFTAVFLIMPSVSGSYWILIAFTALIYLFMYAILFAAAIRLRYSQPDVVRAYRVPGKNIWMWLIAGVGILGVLFTIAVSFIPPTEINTGSIIFYEGFLILGSIVTCLIPFVILFFSKPAWNTGG